jgi:hypothetical protein
LVLRLRESEGNAKNNSKSKESLHHLVWLE